MGRLIRLPLQVHPVEFLARRIASRGEWEKVTVVFPGRRPIVYLRKFLAEKAGKPFIPPRAFSMEDFIKKIHMNYFGPIEEVSPLEGAWRLFNLREKFLDRPEDAVFSSWFFWGVKFFEALEELEKNLVEEKKIREIMEQPQFVLEDFEEDILPRGVERMLSRMVELKREFFRSLTREGKATVGMKYRLVAEHIEERGIPWETDEVYFVGLAALTRAEEKIVGEIMRKPSSYFIYQPLEEDLFSYLKSWGLEEERIEAEEEKPEIFIYQGFDTHSQAYAVKKVIEEERLSPAETAVVLPDSSLLLPLLSVALSGQGLPHNVSMGYPATRTPVYALLDRLMMVQEEKRGEKYRTKSYLNLVLHPYVKNFYFGDRKDGEVTRILIHQVQEALLESRLPYVSLSEIEALGAVEEASQITGVAQEELSEHLSRIHRLFLESFSESSTLKSIAESMGSILEEVYHKSPARFYPLSSPFFKSFLDFFAELSLLPFSQEIKGRDAFSLIRNSLYYLRVPFEGVPLEGLQVLGQLETRALRFRNVIYLAANEDFLPSTEPVDPVLPTPVRKYLGIPTYKDRERVIRYYFMRLLKGSERVFITYSSSPETSRSRFLEEIMWEAEKEGKPLVERKVAFSISTSREPLQFEKTPEVMEKLRAMEFSPTSIDLYMKCPLRFYFTHILSLEEMKDVEEELEVRKIGQFLHEVLYEFYRPYVGKAVPPDYVSFENIEPIFERKFKEFFPYNRGEFFLFHEIARERLKSFLKSERKRAEKNGFKILALEEEFFGELEVGGRKVKLKGRVDRIHESEGKIWVVDYKTGGGESPTLKEEEGRLSTREEMKKKIKSFQLPLYLYLIKASERFDIDSYARTQAALYLLKKNEEKRLFKNKSDEDFLMEEAILPSLKNLLSEILDPDVPFLPDPSDDRYCDHCPFRPLCIP